jgi:sialate O-acetylesterase
MYLKRRVGNLLKRGFLETCRTAAVAALAVLVFAPTARADVRLPSIFGNGMVLQRDMAVPVWGTADPGEEVTVTLKGLGKADDTDPLNRATAALTARTTAGKDGRWMVRLGKLSAGGPWKMTVAGKNSITFENVLAGEVWVCSGQSNMWWTVELVKGIEDAIAAAARPSMRYFSVAMVSSEEPQFDFPGTKPQWVECTPTSVKKFSAIAYFFGAGLLEQLDVPIGLIHSSWGGSIAEAWTSMKTLRSLPELLPIVDNLDSLKAVYPQANAAYQKRAAEIAQAQKEGKVVPFALSPRGPGERDWPSGLYNAMLAPMIPYAIRGAIWYQGESNSVRAAQYRTLFPAMIRDWRKAWREGDFPFLFVQLANWNTETIPVEGTWGSWPELREAQTMALALPRTGMAVAVDIGDSTNIHPNNKMEVGRRLALAALHVAYGRDIVWSGPLYRSMVREGGTIRLRFDHTADGLIALAGRPLTGFEIAGKDRVFHPATARIVGRDVVVSSPAVSDPAAVRYGWDDNPYCTLANSAGLPASPFRTDKWPGITEGLMRPGY